MRDEESSKTAVAPFSKRGLPEAGDPSATLVVIRGESLGRRFSLDRSTNVIGRLPEVDIWIGDRSLSRRHCEIHRIERARRHSYLLRDLRSTNGSYVNGRRVVECYLQDGDKLSVGDVVLKFVLLDALEESFQQELANRLRRDHLTGLLNLTTFYEELEKELRSTQVEETRLGLLMLDVDGLKRVNDTYGHQMGTEVIRSVAHCIHRVVASAGGVSALYGGDEFIVYLPGKGESESVELGEQIRREVEGTAVSDPRGTVVRVSVCIGVVECPEHGTNRELLVRRADLALYEAKREGRNQVVAFFEKLEDAD